MSVDIIALSLRVVRTNALLAILVATALGLAGCTTNAATGHSSFTGFMSEGEEASIGREEHPKIIAEYGLYQYRDLNRYVSSVGTLLARTTERPDIPFTFTVLDTPIVNAFALPGGYVYVTRGLIALADNEAELAGVLGHEIGHVVARHQAQRYSQSVLAGLGAAILGVATGSSAIGNVAGSGAQAYIQSYSRDQEFEADMLGVRYMARAGYDPQAMATFLAKLQADSALDAAIAGSKTDQSTIMSSHPRTADRVERAIAEAGGAPVKNPMVEQAIYYGKIDGIAYGDSADQGFIRGRSFLHPELKLAFEVPEGFTLANNASSVIARGPQGSGIVFNAAPRDADPDPAAYLVDQWARKLALSPVERITINGMAAATATAQGRTSSGSVNVRLLAVRYDSSHIYRFMFITPPAMTSTLSTALRTTTYSFRKLTTAEAARLKPQRIKVIKVAPGETLASLAGRMDFPTFQSRRFEVLNGLGPNRAPPPGSQVKIVSGG